MYTAIKFNSNNRDRFDQVVGSAHDFKFCVHIFDRAKRLTAVPLRLQH